MSARARHVAIVAMGLIACGRGTATPTTATPEAAPREAGPAEAGPATVEPAAPPPVAAPMDRLVPVRFASRDPELPWFARRVAERQAALTACAEAELQRETPVGFVHARFDAPVPQDAHGDVAVTPVVAGVGSSALHACVREALAELQLPARHGMAPRQQLAFEVALRVGPEPPEATAQPDHGDALVLDDDGTCAWVSDPPCAPHKSCLAPERRATRCPHAWGLQLDPSPRPASHRGIFLTRPCADAPAHDCTLAFERDGDRCSTWLRRGPQGEPHDVLAMPCVELERLWHHTQRRAMKSAARRQAASAGPADGAVVLSASRIEPGWRSYRVAQWHHAVDAVTDVELTWFEWALAVRGHALGLPVVAAMGFDPTAAAPTAPEGAPPPW
ncbi:MAG: hypothetical protein K1X88_16810 [Nannocystaceae bacterium]|nr:hypothetical protein [Nannocystaceae bacterium]